MIKANIARAYPSHIAKCAYTNQTVYVVDYTNQTNSRRGTEVFTEQKPENIDSFSLINNTNLEIGCIVFNNKSFKYPNGDPRPQCECVVFPKNAVANSWVLFTELKYCLTKNNTNNLKKAISQLYKTRTYYFNKGIISLDNICYLFASLPTQFIPFANFTISPADSTRLKRKHNIILKLQNHAEIKDDKMIST